MRLSLSSPAALAVLVAVSSSVLASPTAKAKRDDDWRPEGFVRTRGAEFELDGKPFYFSGTNSYWVTQLKAYDDAYKTMASIADAGLKVVRVWGFGTWTSAPTDNSTAYYGVLENGTVTYNWGEDGIQRLDRTVKLAEELGLKLVWPLMNNWDAYGGINSTYVEGFNSGTNATRYHDQFYTEPKIIAQYQDWVRLVVERYKDSPAIFSWQLGNEPRCRGNLPQSGNCTVETLQTWIRNQSAFIKSLDPWHMVSIGSEGFFQWGSNETIYDGLYNGYDGVAFDSDLAIETIDYGTYHLYPTSWTKSDDLGLFGQQWIREHAYAQVASNKPTVLEEFGLGDGPAEVNSTRWLPAWYETALNGNTAGIMQWQWGICGLQQRGPGDLIDANGCSPNDGHATYPGNATYTMLLDSAKAQEAKNWA